MNVLAAPTDRQNAKSRLALGLALGPAFIVALTAWFALPEQAGGYRLAKWGQDDVCIGSVTCEARH